jgi:hypothetical protein
VSCVFHEKSRWIIKKSWTCIKFSQGDEERHDKESNVQLRGKTGSACTVVRSAVQLSRATIECTITRSSECSYTHINENGQDAGNHEEWNKLIHL